MEHYYAVQRSGLDDELQHFKYIKRVKGKNGKWRYYYDTTKDSMYKTGAKVTMKSSKGGQETKNYGESNSLFGSKTTLSFKDNNGSLNTSSDYKRGALERAQAKAEKWLFDKVFSRKK